MSKYKIILEDNGQDFLEFIVENDVIIDVFPFQKEIWKGAYILIEMVIVGEKCPIHKPPYINFGELKYNVEELIDITNEE